jgi:hypothetical protein
MIKRNFSEQQQYRQPWLWSLLIALFILSLYFIFQQIIIGLPVGTSPAPDIGLIIVAIFLLGIIAFFFSIKLETQIDSIGIYYRFYPIQRKFREIKWEVVNKAYIRKYSPIAEYGGWGIRFGMSNGMAYNIKGTKGLQLELVNGDKILFGTQIPDEMEKVLSNLNKIKV